MIQPVQSIEAKVKVIVPDDYELVERDELDSLRSQALTGRTWTMQDLRTWMGNKSAYWVRKNVLENPRFSRDIQLMINRHEVQRPSASGQRWLFKAKPMAEFLEHHYSEFDW